MGKSKCPKKSGSAGRQASRLMTAEEARELTSCDVDRYEELLAAKVRKVRGLLEEVIDLPGETKVFPSPPSHFRQRANFRVWHEPLDGEGGEDVNFIMYRPGAEPKEPLRVTDFPRSCARTNALMGPVRQALRGSAVLRSKVIECRFHTTLRGGAMVLLAYNRPIDEDSDWRPAAEALARSLGPDVVVVGRSKRVQIAVGGPNPGAPQVEETLRVAAASQEGPFDVALTQVEGEFSQPNGAVCEKMLGWAVDATRPPGGGAPTGDLLELYCGNGNFTVPLSRNFRKVLATEVTKPNTEVARTNCEANGRTNVKIARLSAVEISEAIARTREFSRLKERFINLDDYDLRTLFVDPPRCGLDADTMKLAHTFETVVYMSCGPETLADNLYQLSATHAVEDFACFDQFPYTDHCECAVLLRRKPEADRGPIPEPRPKEVAVSRRYAKKHVAREKKKAAKEEKKAGKKRAASTAADANGTKRPKADAAAAAPAAAASWKQKGCAIM